MCESSQTIPEELLQKRVCGDLKCLDRGGTIKRLIPKEEEVEHPVHGVVLQAPPREKSESENENE